MANKINFQVGFNIDKTNLNELTNYLQQIQTKAEQINPGSKMDQELKKAASTAKQLETILQQTYNADLGSINATKFNQELQKANLTVKSIKTDLSGAGSQGAAAFNRLSQSILGTNTQLRESNKLLDSMAITMVNTVKWGITSSIFNTITNAIQKAYTYSKQLDTSLNNIRIVTGKSADEMDLFAEKANNAAKALGASTLDYTNASLIYYQQGLSNKEAQARAETTVKVANITGQTGNAVSEELTAVWNGYKVSAEETEVYIDKLAAVAATTASDLEELSTGMSKVASAANAMGVDFDDLNAQIATIVSVTRQAPESVGTALKTIYARLGDLKVDGVDEFGVKLGEVSSQLRTMGIEILDANGDMRDMSSVMTEVAEKWDTWTRAQQQAAAVAMAGKRQYNNLVALFENWDMYSEALETSKNSLGTLQEQQDIYMESTAAKLKTLKATWQDLYQGLLKSDDINKAVEGLTSLVDLGSKFIKSFGGGIKTFAAFGVILTNIFSNQISKYLNELIQKQTIYKNNLEQIKQKAAVQNAGVAMAGPNASVSEQAIAENSKIQLEYAEKIYNIKGALSQEEYNTLTNYQTELGFLKEEELLLNDKLEKKQAIYNIDENISNKLKDNYDVEMAYHDEMSEVLFLNEKIDEYLSEAMTNIKMTDAGVKEISIALSSIDNFFTENKDIIDGTLLEGAASKLTAQQHQLLEDLNNQNITEEEILTHKVDVLKIMSAIVSYGKEQTADLNKEKKQAQELKDIYDKINKNQIRQDDIKGNFSSAEEIAKRGTSIINTFNGITSSLGSLAMGIGSINTLFDVWADKEQDVGKKLLQTITTLGMTIPTLISSLNKLKDSLGITSISFNTFAKTQQLITASSEAMIHAEETQAAVKEALLKVREKENVVKVLSKQIDQDSLKIAQAKIKSAGLENAVTQAGTNAAYLRARAKMVELELSDEEIAALIANNKLLEANTGLEKANTSAKMAQAKATAAATEAEKAHTKAMASNPYGLALIAIAALITAIVAVVKWYKKAEEAAAEQRKESIENAKALKDELDSSQELITSFKELVEQYKEGTASKEDLAKSSEELCKKYDIEIDKVDQLLGKYDDYIGKIDEARKKELEGSLSEQEEATKNSLTNFAKSIKSTDASTTLKFEEDNRTGIVFDRTSGFDFSNLENQYFNNKNGLDKFIFQGINGENLGFKVNLDDTKDVAEFYQGMKDYYDAITKEVREGRADKEILESEYVKQIKDFLTDTEEDVQTIKEVSGGYYSTLAALEVYNFNDEDFNSFEDKYNDAIISLAKKANISLETAREYLDNALVDSNENYEKFLAIEEIADKYTAAGLSEEKIEKNKELLKQELAKLSDEDFNKVISSVDFNNISSLENFKNAIKLVQNQIDSADLGVVASLRSKISSDKKLTKTEMKEALGEQETLTSEYEIGLYDWDSQSQIDQVEILNDIVRDKIRINNEYIENIKETAEAEKKIYGEQKDNLENEYQTLRNKREASQHGGSGIIWTQEDEEHYAEVAAAYEDAVEKVEYWNAVAEKGLSFEELNNFTFDNLISGIDGLISETQVLADLVAKVGENWTIAGKDIQEFALNFPEVLAEQENFNYLQDGSIQLTETGKKALDESLNSYKEKIILENKAYQEELQRQADIQYATAEMYEAQAKALDDYLAGRKTGKETEATLEKNYTNYKEKLIKQLGISDEELNNLMRQNGFTTAEEEVANQENIFKGWVSVGEIAAKAGMAYSTKEFNANEVVSPSGKQTAVKVTAAESYNPKTYDAGGFQGLTNEDIAAYRDQLLKQAQAARNQGDIYLSKKLGAGTQTQAMINAMGNAVSGKGNGKSSKSKEEKEKEIDEEFDRYWEYKKAIDMLDKAMARLEKTQSKLHGKELIDSLKEENKLLEKQKANYEALIQAQEREAGELQGKLNYYGAIFSDNGELANYADLTSNMLSQLTSGQVSEKAYEDFKKALERYDSLYYSEMQDTLDKLDDARRKQLENNLKAWQIDIDIQLDLTKAKRAWNDFVRDLEQDFRKIYSDLTIESAYDTANFDTYVDDLNTTLQAIHDVENEITKLASVGKSDMFESMSDAQEKLKELGEDLIENGKSLYDLYKSVWDNYIDKLDQAADNLNDINDEFGHITDELEHEKKLIELIYGDKAYDKMTKFYNAQQKNINLQIDSLKTQKQFWEDQFNAAYMMNKDDHNVILEDMSTWTEDMRKAYDQMIDSQEALNDKIVDGIDNLTNNYLNKLAETFDNLEKAVWNMNLDDMTDDWDRITDLAGEYLDDVEGAYQIQSLANKIDKDINNTNNLKAAQALQAFREKEIAILREKDNLTQDDIDLAEARYQIMLKQIALEDAQNAKTSMKLTRNTSGNWTYQYVADEDDTADKQQELLQAYQNLYTMADNAYQHAMELATGSYQEMQDKIKGIAEDTTLAEEEKMLKIQEIQDTYLPMIEAAVENSELYRQEATTATGAVFEEVCQQDADAYQYLTDLQKTLVDEVKDKHLDDYEAIRSAVVDGVYPEIAAAAQNAFLETNLNSSTAAADVIHQWADDDGESVKAKLNEAIDSIEDNVKEFEGELDNMKVIAGEDFTAVDMEIEKTVKWLDTMEDKTEEMATHSAIVLDTMRTAVEKLSLSFNGVIDKVYEAYNAMADYKEAVGMAIDQMRQFNIVAQEYGGIDLSGLLNNGGNPPATPSTAGKVSVLATSPTADNKWIEKVTFTSASGKVYSGQIRTDKSFGGEMTEEMFKQRLEEEYKDNGYISGFDGLIIYDKDTHLPRFATGGYTGDWGSDHGKLAILDSKELVLNETDTSNFLRATNLLRDISKINGSIEDSIMTSILGMMSALSPHIGGFSTGQGKNGTSGNIFNITAEFPNANDVTSIREAILSLPNLASQYVHQSM